MSKLTLSIDDDIIAKAKVIAGSKGMSVSGMFSNYVVSLTSSVGSRDEKPAKVGRLARQATGLIHAQGVDEKAILASALLEKHGF